MLLRPLLQRYALARPNARSSHVVPTPQGGGVAVLAAAFVVAAPLTVLLGGRAALPDLAVLAAAALVLAVTGAVDDVRPLSPALRLVLQVGAVTSLVQFADPGRILPEPLPLALERTLLILAGVWWVNLVNFMDGIDWITVAQFVPLTGALVLFGIAGGYPPMPAAVAAALCGALLGFAPANRPVARLFLGDVGSLPLGLVSGWLLLELAAAGHLAAALLLPLYHLADATLTLALRARRRERLWEAHRSHFYQRASDRGLRVMEIDRHVFGLNLGLAALAAATLWASHLAGPALAVGGALVALTLWRFGHRRRVHGR